MAATRRVVITGMGLLTPLGVGRDAYWKGLAEGRSGVRAIRNFDASGLPVRIAGEVETFDPRLYVEKHQRKGLRMMARTIQLAVAGATLALEDARVDKSQLDPARFGVAFGSGLIATELPDLADAAVISSGEKVGEVDPVCWAEQGLPAIQPLWMLKHLPNMPACHVSILHNAQGPNNSITENEVAGLLALGEATRVIRRDAADLFLSGAAESRINPLSMVRQCLFEKLSRRNEEPEKASRPFDRGRDGFVLGEGAGVLVLEELEHAQRRGARIEAEVVGFGAAFDIRRDGDGLVRAIHIALKQAGIGPDQIDHVNAHGLSTPEADAVEASALQRVFGSNPDVLAVKSSIGNLGAAGGPVELAGSLLGWEQGRLPGALNYDDPDPHCPVHVLTGEARSPARPHVLKVAFTSAGQCAALVVRRVA